MNKKGQIYILAALILSIVVFSLSQTINKFQQEELEEDLPSGLLGPAPYDRRELKEKGTDSERVTNWDIAYGTDTLHPGRKGVRFVKTEARSARDFK